MPEATLRRTFPCYGGRNTCGCQYVLSVPSWIRWTMQWIVSSAFAYGATVAASFCWLPPRFIGFISHFVEHEPHKQSATYTNAGAFPQHRS